MSVYQSTKSKFWQFEVPYRNKRYARSSKIKIEGSPEAPEGSSAYMQYWESFKAAQKVRDDLKDKLTAQNSQQAMAEEIYQMRHGASVPEIPLANLYKRWETKIEQYHGNARSARYRKQVNAMIDDFRCFALNIDRSITTMSSITHDIALGYLEEKWNCGITPKTWNNYLQILRSVFSLLAHEGGCRTNPFAGLPTRRLATIHKEPFDKKATESIIQTAEKKGDEIAHLVLAGLCTGLRRGDTCRLRWSAISEDYKILKIETSKTGKTVQIPIFPPLRRALMARGRLGEYIFPSLAAMIEKNPDGVTLRVKQFLDFAGFQTCDVKRERGVRRANTRGYHSLRTTFITLAFEAGVPESVIKQVTGHTSDVIARYYYQPRPESIREVFKDKMPEVFK